MAALTSAWFSVPEGEAGQIVNDLATVPESFSLNPIHDIEATWNEIADTIRLATGASSAVYTVIHVVGAGKVAVAEKAGLTPYTTKAQAQAAANAKTTGANNPVNIAYSVINAIGNFANKLGEKSLWLRVAEFAVGAILLTVALNALLKETTGVDVSKSIPKVVPV